MATATLALQTLAFLLLFICPSISSESSLPSMTQALGFGAKLIHRDSSQSPFYKPNATAADRWSWAIQRTTSRLRYFERVASLKANSMPSIGVPTIPIDGEYLMSYYVGTPGVHVAAIADTGSDIIWNQCEPCSSCYNQKDPIYDTRRSSSYKVVPCDSRHCKYLLPSTRCRDRGRTCVYHVEYMDGDFSHGVLSKEVFTVTSPGVGNVSLNNVVFGCGQNNSDDFPVEIEGIVGLGIGAVSLVGQLGAQMDYKFSYCLVRRNNDPNQPGSPIWFGNKAVLLGNGTPLAVPGNKTAWYYLTLEDISVGSQRLRIPAGTFEHDPWLERGGVVIDSGTPVTTLKKKGFDMLVDKLRKVIKLRPVTNPVFELCFEGRTRDVIDGGKLPVITFHFKGLDVTLQPWSTFYEIAVGEICLMMRPSSSLSIFGNLNQQNFHIGYDMKNEIVYISPSDCPLF